MIVRNRSRNNFSIIPNQMLNDKRLSFEARGLLSYLLSKPDNWNVSIEFLSKESEAGKDKIRRILAELAEAGYLVQQRTRAEDGTFGWESFIYDTSQTARPASDLPSSENPTTDEPTLISTDLTTSSSPSENKTKHKTKTRLTDFPSDLKSQPEIRAYHDEHLNNSSFDEVFDNFRDYHEKKGNKFASWAAAWRTWVRNQKKFSAAGEQELNAETDWQRQLRVEKENAAMWEEYGRVKTEIYETEGVDLDARAQLVRKQQVLADIKQRRQGGKGSV